MTTGPWRVAEVSQESAGNPSSSHPSCLPHTYGSRILGVGRCLVLSGSPSISCVPHPPPTPGIFSWTEPISWVPCSASSPCLSTTNQGLTFPEVPEGQCSRQGHHHYRIFEGCQRSKIWD